jgi:uncharacterized protein YprB with RNaseH-like and TPR domain
LGETMATTGARRRKLELLTRSIAAGDMASASEMLRAHGHSGINRARRGEGGEGNALEPMRLAEACPGSAATAETFDGPAEYYLIRRTLADVAPRDVSIAADYAAVMRGARQQFDELAASAALCHASDCGPGDLLFMDTETCGLASAAIFLVGMMRFEAEELVFEQCLARDYSLERAILAAFAARSAEARVLVTFNGKSFDMTMIRDRSAFWGVDLPPRQPAHLDLLHEVRRRWRKELPNCRLQTLERYFCGRRRVGDIPGSAIPEAYHRFVAGGDARQMADIVHHNLLDLLTMAQLVVAILTGCGPAVE